MHETPRSGAVNAKASAPQLQTPVSFFTFNRPIESRQIFETIRAARPTRLMMISDAARIGVAEEAEKVAACRALLEEVDWPCDIQTNFASENMGCGRRLSSGIDWVLSNVDRSIFLEDDCLPHPSFFRFCTELLDRYAKDERIGTISGDNFQQGRRWNSDSYYFSRITHIWGWATWSRAWEKYDFKMRDWPEFLSKGGLEKLFPDPVVVEYWKQIMSAYHAGKIDTWDYPWLFTGWNHDLLSIVPAVNLVSNIGLIGTHYSEDSPSPTIPTEAMEFPMHHPTDMTCLQAADFFTFRTAFRLPCRDPESLLEDQRHRPETFTSDMVQDDAYDKAWRWGLSQPHLHDLVRLCYKTPDQAINAKSFETSDEFRAILDLLGSLGQGPRSRKKVLDFGCGNAIATWAMTGQGYDVTGIDSSPGALAGLGAGLKLKGFEGRDFALHISRGEFLPYPDATFDVVMMRQVLHHITDLPGFLAEVRRVLKPGGVVCAFRDHVIWNESQRESFFRTHPFNHITQDENCHYLTEYLDGFRKAGFGNVVALDPFATVINTFPGPFVPGLALDTERARSRQDGNDLYSFYAVKPVSTAASRPEAFAASPSRKSVAPIVIDGVFFQAARTGIARLWENLLRQWSGTPFGDRILLLDRAGTCPSIERIRKLPVGLYGYERAEADRRELQAICDREGAVAFASTYYTTPLTTPSIFVAYDMIPEYSGTMDASITPWPQKHDAIRRACGFIAISEHTASDLARFHPPARDTTTVALCGIDRSVFHPSKPGEVDEFRKQVGMDRPYFLFVGSKIGYKNAVLFLEAFHQLPDRDQLGIVFCGGETLDERTLSGFVGMARVVQARLDDSTLRAAYSGALALVHPSLYEGFGLPLLEAMACGCPVVACRNSSIPEVGGDAILYIDEPSSETLACGMREIRKTEVRDRLVRLGLDRATGFTWKQMADTVRGVLETLPGSREDISNSHPPEVLDCLVKAAEMLTSNRAADVESTLECHAILESRDARIQRAAGNLLLRAGLMNQARAKFLLSTRLDPNDADAYLDLAVTWMMLQQNTEAEIAVRRALELSPSNGAAWKILGQIKLQQKDLVAGVESYRKSLEFLPDDAECLVLVGAWLCRRGDFEQARPLLEKAQRICPSDPGIREELDKLPTASPLKIKAPLGRVPLVSAIVSTYKSESFLRGCLQDLVEQTLFAKGELEIVVVDSASPEGESLIVREFQSLHPNIRYIRTVERETLYAAWNRGIRAARGRYVTNANTDDTHRRDALEILAAALDAHPETDLAFADCIWTNRPNDPWENTHSVRKTVSYPDYHPESCLFWCTLGPHPMWRKTVFEKVGWFDPAYKAAGDLEYLIRFTFRGGKAVHVPLPLSLFYQNPKGLTLDDSTSGLETAEIFRTARQLVPIARIYDIDPDDRAAVAAAWIALAHRSLEFQIPWREPHTSPEFALECLQRALQADPDSDYARVFATELAKSLNRSPELTDRPAGSGPLCPIRPPEPGPHSRPIRWEPGRGAEPPRPAKPIRGPGHDDTPKHAVGEADPRAPLVSAIVSTYKSESYMRGCLQDLVDQTLFAKGELEIVVVDSASPQAEGDIVREFQSRHPNIRYIRTAERETLYAAWNRGIREARGRYVTNANTDDAHHPQAIELLAAALDANPDTDLAFGDLVVTNRANDTWEDPTSLRDPISYPDYHPATCLYLFTVGCHPMWRRTVFERVGWFDPAYKAAGDLEYLIRFTFHGGKAVHVPVSTSLFFQNGNGLSLADPTSGQETANIFQTARKTLPIAKLYDIDPEDRAAVAAAWITLGHSTLQYKTPWGSVHGLPDFAFDCFQMALQADPTNDYAYVGASELAKALGRSADAPQRPATIGAMPPLRPVEPRPFSGPIRWDPKIELKAIREKEEAVRRLIHSTSLSKDAALGSISGGRLSSSLEKVAAGLRATSARPTTSVCSNVAPSSNHQGALKPAPGKLTISSLDKLARSITMQPAMPEPSNAPASKPPEPEDDLEEMGRMLLLAEASAARGGLAEADRITEEVTDRFPRQNMAWLARAMVLRGLGRFKKAADAIAKALQVRETPEALLEAMQIHLLADEAAPARKAEKALKERHAAWFKATREEFRASGKPWPPDFTKPTKKARSGPSARPVKK